MADQPGKPGCYATTTLPKEIVTNGARDLSTLQRSRRCHVRWQMPELPSSHCRYIGHRHRRF